MQSDQAPIVRSGYINPPMNSDLESEYAHLREELERLMTEPVKEEQGIKGNNPNE